MSERVWILRRLGVGKQWRKRSLVGGLEEEIVAVVLCVSHLLLLVNAPHVKLMEKGSVVLRLERSLEDVVVVSSNGGGEEARCFENIG